MKHGESGGPEPLTFTHNGEPATIDLERFQQQPQAEPLTFTHNGQPATIDLERFKPQPQAEQPAPVEVKRPVAPEPLTFTHNGQPATVDLERFTRQPQKEIHMKHGEIGAPRNTGDVGIAPVPEVGSVKIVILNGSRQIDQVVPGVGQNGAAGWQTQKVLGENGLPQGIYQLSSANDASKKVHPSNSVAKYCTSISRTSISSVRATAKASPPL